MTVAVVTDSAATIPSQVVAARGIAVVPMWLTIDGRPEPEGPGSLLDVVAADDVTTSAPAPGEFAETIRAVRGDDGVVVLTIASTMSASHAAAQLAARDIGDDVRVVDTSTAAGAQGLVVLAASDAARAGADVDEVERVARRVADQVRLVATLESLDHLARSGRVPGIAERARRRLGVAPLFEFVDGKARPLRPALSRAAALDRIVGRVLRGRDGRPAAALRVFALHALAPDDAEHLLGAVRAQLDGEPAVAFVGEFNSVMVAHTGPGLAGLAWHWDSL